MNYHVRFMWTCNHGLFIYASFRRILRVSTVRIFLAEQGMGHSEWPMAEVIHWALDPWPMGHRGRHPILAQALHRFIDYPALYLDTVYVHTPLSCYISLIAHVSKLHTQAPVNLEFWYIIIATIYKPSHNLMGHGSTPSDPWPMTHRPIPCSVLGLLHKFRSNNW